MPDSRSKPQTKTIIKRTLLATGALIALTAIAAVALVIHLLPNLREVSQTLKSIDRPEATPQHTVQSRQASQRTQAPTNSESQIKQTAKPTAEKTAANQDLKKESFQKVLQVMDEDPKDLRVCQNLGQSQFLSEKHTEIQLDELMEKRDDSYIEATRFPMKAILQDEKVSSLLKEISEIEKKNLSDAEEKSFLQKAGFYSKVALTVGHLYQEKENFEELGNRANHLALIAKLAALKPELAHDANITKFCDELQASIADRKRANVKEERKEILNLIHYAGLTPEALGFNPDEYIKLKIQHSDKEFRIELNEKDSEAPQETTL